MMCEYVHLTGLCILFFKIPLILASVYPVDLNRNAQASYEEERLNATRWAIPVSMGCAALDRKLIYPTYRPLVIATTIDRSSEGINGMRISYVCGLPILYHHTHRKTL